MPDARRRARLLAQVGLRLRQVADRTVDLVDRARDDRPEEGRDQAGEDEVVEPDPGCARHAAAGEALDRRPHRRGEDERQEEERDDEPQLPEREREHDDAADDEGREGGALGGLLHGPEDAPTARTLPLYEHTFAR